MTDTTKGREMKKRNPTKIERMILALPGGLCEAGRKKAARKYRGLTLQQAWKKAGLADLTQLGESLKVKPPVRCRVGCGTQCWGNVNTDVETADDLRKMLRGIPKQVRAAYAKS